MGKGDRDVRSRVVPGALTGTLSPLAKCFNPERITHVSQEHMENTDMDVHRSLAMTGVDETEPPCLNNIATMGLADSIETEQPVAEADVAEPGGPAVTGTGGPVVWEKKMRPAADSTGASGSRNGRTEAPVTLKFGSRSEIVMPASGLAETGTGGPVGIMKERSDVDGSAEIGMRTGTEYGEPVVAGTTFTTVAEVYAPFSGRKSQEGADSGRLDLSGDSTMDRTDVIREVSNTDQELKLSECSLDCSLDSGSEEDDEIMVGVVGSTAPWYLTGWTNDVEVEFMIDTGCQVTILATSVFDRMCDIHPEVKLGLKPCAKRLVSADSSPLGVKGRVNLNIVFPGLRCDMWCVVADIGTDGLLGTEALHSSLPHQLDLHTGQLRADGRPTLQLHQRHSPPLASCSLITAVVLPPNSEVVAEFSITGDQVGSCALIDPNWGLTEEFGVMVGHTLVDATSPLANVLLIN